MKLKLAVVLLVLIALAGCSDSPEVLEPEPAEVAATELPAATEAAEGTGEPAATADVAETEGSGGATPEPAEALGSPEETGGYVRLQTLAGAEEGKCLNGNRVADGAFLGGAAFMDDCQDVPGQLWTLVPAAQEGYSLLQTQALAAENKCLEGNRVAEESLLGGAAFMSDCSGASGQSWKFVEGGDGAYRLQTQFLEGENMCLEGNRVAEGALLGGAAHMDECQDGPGQLWQLVPLAPSAGAAEGPAGLDELAAEPEPLAVEIAGNTLTVNDPTSSLNGMTITQPEGSGEALSQLSLGQVEIESAPPVPEWVTPLSDVFVVPTTIEQPLELRFPLADLPPEVALGEVDLYVYGVADHAEGNIWLPSWVEYAYEGTPQAPIVVVDVGGLAGLAYWGYGAPAEEGATGSLDDPAGKLPFLASLAAQEQSDPCVEQYANNIVDPRYFVGHICASDGITVTIRGFGQAATRWQDRISKGQLLALIRDAQLWLARTNMGFDAQFNVHVHQLPAGVSGQVRAGPPEDGKTLHLSSDDKIRVESTVVHEYFHHAQYHPRTEVAGQYWVREKWITEGTARWSEDEIHDAKNIYTLRPDLKMRILEAGLVSDVYDTGLLSPYGRALFFKLMTRSCPQFVPQIKPIFSKALTSGATGIATLTSLLGQFGCDFGDHLGSDRAASIEAALAYYNYATQHKDKLTLLDANEPETPFFEKPPASRFTLPRGVTTVEQWLGSAVAVATLPEVTIPPVGAYSFVIPGLTGTVPEGRVAQLVVESRQPVIVSLTSTDPQFSGMNTIGPDNDPHAWFSTPATTPTTSTPSRTAPASICSYSYAGNAVPQLFVTLVNPSLSQSAAGVKVSLQIVATSAAQQTPCATPAPSPSPAVSATATATPAAATATAPDGATATAPAGVTPAAGTWQVLVTFTDHADLVRSVAWSPDGSKLASAGHDQAVRVWDAVTGAGVVTLTGHTDIAWGVAWSPDGSKVASASLDGTARTWDAATGASLMTFPVHRTRVHSVAWSPDGSKLAAASDEGTVRVWDAVTGASVVTLTGHTDTGWSVAWSPDGSKVASASSDQTVRVWDAATGAGVVTLTGHTDTAWSVAWSPDGSKVASASSDQTVRVWDAATGASLATLTGHTDRVLSVSWSPDGGKLASASEDQTVRVWDATTGASLATLTGHTDSVFGVAWTPDSSKLASASFDKTVRVWGAGAGPGTASGTAPAVAAFNCPEVAGPVGAKPTMVELIRDSDAVQGFMKTVNCFREARNLEPLQPDLALGQACQWMTDLMATHNKLDHNPVVISGDPSLTTMDTLAERLAHFNYQGVRPWTEAAGRIRPQDAEAVGGRAAIVWASSDTHFRPFLSVGGDVFKNVGFGFTQGRVDPSRYYVCAAFGN